MVRFRETSLPMPETIETEEVVKGRFSDQDQDPGPGLYDSTSRKSRAQRIFSDVWHGVVETGVELILAPPAELAAGSVLRSRAQALLVDLIAGLDGVDVRLADPFDASLTRTAWPVGAAAEDATIWLADPIDAHLARTAVVVGAATRL